jgi:lysophospholipase L1-like esterase
MHWYEAEVSALEQVLAHTPMPACAWMFYGSSSIRLWHTLAIDLHPTPVINAGFGGSTLEACNYYFERLVKPFQPTQLILYAGDNDLSDGRTPAQVFASFQNLLSKLDTQLPSTRLAVLAIKPSPARWHLQPDIHQTNQMIRASLAGRDNRSYLDVSQPMLTPQGQLRAELYQADGLHLTAAGYALWASILNNYRQSLR